MAVDQFDPSLQTAVLAVLCFDDGFGAQIAAQIKTTHFDTVYRDFAAAVLKYRKEYHKAPGEKQITHLVEQSAYGRETRAFMDEFLPALIEEGEGLNSEYIASRVQEFIRYQQTKQSIVAAGDAWEAARDGSGGSPVPKIEKIYHDYLYAKKETFSAGTYLSDTNNLRFLDKSQLDFVSLRIPELDYVRVGLIPKQVLLYIAPKGSGKTHFCVHCGKCAILQHQKVLHVTLEEDGDTGIIPRYYQSLFGVAQDNEKYNRTIFEFDSLDRVNGFKTKNVKPRLDFEQEGIKKILREKMKNFGSRFGNLIVKTFPTSTLTTDELVSYLDYLAEVEGFIPNVLIVDYPKLMKTDAKNLRIDLGKNFEELRGICGQRNMAGVFPHQGTRETIGAKRVRSKQAGEDISVVQTADMVLSYQRTEKEEELGLGRLSVEHVRKAKSGSMILLSQAYAVGQYVISSALMTKSYWDRVKELSGGDEDEG